MKLIDNYQNNLSLKNGSVIVIGNFDGVHLGHQKLIKDAKNVALQQNRPLILITFEPHPISFFKPKLTNYRLTNSSQKQNLLRKLGIDYLLEINFNEEFSLIEADEFIENILVKNFKAKHIIVGYDFVFGHNKSGNGELLKSKSEEFLYSFDQIKAIGKDEIYSSSSIREALKNGDTKKAKNILGRNFSIIGKIIKGQQLGRTIGFPTININYSNYLLPQNGVYSASLRIDNKTYDGILNLGNKPTVKGNAHTLEIHIFDFDQDVYNKEAEIEFLDKIRDEIQFNSLNDLQKQIIKDCETVKLQLQLKKKELLV